MAVAAYSFNVYHVFTGKNKNKCFEVVKNSWILAHRQRKLVLINGGPFWGLHFHTTYHSL